MKAIWIGVGVGPELRKTIIANNGKLLSAQVSESNLIQGIDALDIPMDTLNGPNIGSGVLSDVPPETWCRNKTSHDMSVGYKNIKYLNLLLKQRALCREARRWAKDYRHREAPVIFVYSMHAPFMAAACEVKKYLPHAKICQIVPDLPQYMDLKMSRLKKVLKALDWQQIKYYMKKVDRYVLYAQPMAQFLGLKDGQWTVMEGSYDSTQLADENAVPAGEKTTVMYSGVLDLRYGIPELLDAMELLGDSYELWLTGAGNAVPLIRERAEADSRIKFYGYLPSRQDLLNQQAQATMLINPRRDTEEASKYCFPSKLFEYMASGRPTISCFLAGIPEEYHSYLVELPTVTPQQIAQTIEKVARMPQQEQKALGDSARKFVLEQKNKYAQSKKMVLFVTDGEDKATE